MIASERHARHRSDNMEALHQLGALHAYPPTKSGNFSVAVDHFTFLEPAPRFGLRWAAYESFAKPGSNAPVLFYCGNEGPLEVFYNATGAMFEHGKALGAHVVFVEHRYYGTSLPFGNNASFTKAGLRFLSIEQALADYAEMIAAFPRLIGCTGTGARAAAGRCDVVLFGGSYGGMLAAWHRLKFPHLSVGAIASGAPIDFYWGVQPAFRAAYLASYRNYGGHPRCAATLENALDIAESASPAEMHAAGIQPCAPLAPDSAERYAFYAKGAMASIAMADYPYAANFIAPLPANPLLVACTALLTNSTGRTPGTGQRVVTLAALHRAVLGLVNASHDLKCVNLRAEQVGDTNRAMEDVDTSPPLRPRATLRDSHMGVVAWNYQACTELPFELMTSDGYGFFPPSHKQLGESAKLCLEEFGVLPRPDWMPTAFGLGPDFEAASNIVFMENDKDPCVRRVTRFDPGRAVSFVPVSLCLPRALVLCPDHGLVWARVTRRTSAGGTLARRPWRQVAESTAL